MVEIRAADTLLDVGIRVRYGHRRSLCFKRLRLGSQLAMEREMLATGLTAENLEGLTQEAGMRLMAAHGERFARMVAIAWLGRWWVPLRWLTRPMSRWVMRRMSAWHVIRTVDLLLYTCSVSDFINTTRLMLSAPLTSAKNLGQEASGS